MSVLLVPEPVTYKTPLLGLNEAIRTSGQEALLSSLIPLLPTWLFSSMVMMVEVEADVEMIGGGVYMCVSV